ncbi:hypothetical protein [Streptomyces vinaceus]|uniref:hypothetical protein n=1 Tax=Streptomyces vinaceus TaxID=1960 RepID=UPI0036BE8690
MPAVRPDYLPHALVTGFATRGPRPEARGPRVAGFGRDRRPAAAAALAAGPLVVERPALANLRLASQAGAAMAKDRETVKRTEVLYPPPPVATSPGGHVAVTVISCPAVTYDSGPLT